jgi:hypothetical protein
LRALVADAFGPTVALEVAPGVAFGAEDEAALAMPAGTSHAIALFDLSATPESENQAGSSFVSRRPCPPAPRSRSCSTSRSSRVASPASASGCAAPRGLAAVGRCARQHAAPSGARGPAAAMRRRAWRGVRRAERGRGVAMNVPRVDGAPAPAPTDGLPHRSPDADIALSLVSHTNAGKTTLARTLLREDVGEVRDAPHVTEFAEVRTMIATPGGERLLLWDTPGFGDSVRLAKRLRQSTQPLGWFLSQVWDRWRDRPFWASQQAMKNLRDEADVMLYLVNAAESPEAAGYVAPRWSCWRGSASR